MPCVDVRCGVPTCVRLRLCRSFASRDGVNLADLYFLVQAVGGKSKQGVCVFFFVCFGVVAVYSGAVLFFSSPKRHTLEWIGPVSAR